MPAARKKRERKSIDHGNEGGRRVSPAYLPWPWGVWYERIETNLLCQSNPAALAETAVRPPSSFTAWNALRSVLL